MHQPQFRLAYDLKKDRVILKGEHGQYNRHLNFKEFYPYTRIDLSGFKYSKYVSGRHNVQRWEHGAKNKLVIYQVLSTIAIDTMIYKELVPVDVDTRMAQVTQYDTVRIKTQTKSTSYIIEPAKGKTLIYITGNKNGLHKYYLGDKAYMPIYEAIELYIKYPDKDELMKAVSR